MYDPFIFEMKEVSYNKPYRYFDRRLRRHVTRVRSFKFVDLVYTTQSRTLAEWREISIVFNQLVAKGVITRKLTPDIYRVGVYMNRRLHKFGKLVCGQPHFRSAREQHPVDHVKYSWDGAQDFIVNEPLLGTNISFTSLHTYYTPEKFIFWSGVPVDAPSIPYLIRPSGYSNYGGWTNDIRSKYMDDPWTQLNSEARNIASMLWPDAQELVDNTAKPLVDVAEAVVDGTILGTPPSATDAAPILMDAKRQKYIESLASSIDFAANSWLWAKLVLQPVLSSASSLLASVQANDNRILKLNSLIRRGEWIQGRHMRLHSNISCLQMEDYVPPFFLEKTTKYVHETLHETYDFRKYETNANFAYKLSTESMVTSSAQQLGLFFQTLSSDLTNVAWNLVPLSFVVDWFTNNYSGQLSLDEKVYIPVAESKLSISQKIDMEVVREYKAVSSVTKYIWKGYDGCYPTYESGVKLAWNGEPLLLPGGWYTCLDTITVGFGSLDIDKKYIHRYERYRRSVHTNLTPSQSASVHCRTNDTNLTTGQSITLGALIWSFIRK
jgi:hypothetical protein